MMVFKGDAFERILKEAFREKGLQKKLEFLQWALQELEKDLAFDSIPQKKP